MFQHRRTTFLLLGLLLASLCLGVFGASAAPRRTTLKVFVDTDIGVDDATAIAWLMNDRSTELIGFTTVAGNATVENATQNLLTLLDVANRTIPVTIGAAEPLEFPFSKLGMFVHGPSGLWFSQTTHEISGLPNDAPAAIAAAARANPGMTLIALGPMTNVAQAAQRFPTDMTGVRIIALAGTRGPGNRTPVSEFNAFADPQALDVLLESGLNVTLITQDSFDQVKVDSTTFVQNLTDNGGAMGQFLASVLQPYFYAATQGAGGMVDVPDATAAIYALRPEMGTPTSSLVDVSTDGGLTRGQTVIGTDAYGKVTMIADDQEMSALAERAFTDPSFDINMAMYEILTRRPDNAQVVLSVKGPAMAKLLERGLTQK